MMCEKTCDIVWQGVLDAVEDEMLHGFVHVEHDRVV